jgi:hypothetical protein
MWQVPVQVMRSARGGSCGAAWQFVQSACPATAWSAGKLERAWHVVHAGGAATPFGPWGR